MLLTQINACPFCKSENLQVVKTYDTKNNGSHCIIGCQDCHQQFSNTYGSFLHRIRKPIQTIVSCFKELTTGTGINACCQNNEITKPTLYNWIEKFSAIKPCLLLYALCHQYINMVIEGDELYTKVKKNVPQQDSLGWTIVFLERRTRFIWLMQCGKKDKQLFKDAIRILYQVIQQTQDFKLFTDGEHRYANMLFDICYQLIYTGRRPKKHSPKVCKYESKTKVRKLINVDEKDLNTNNPKKNIFKTRVLSTTLIFMLIM